MPARAWRCKSSPAHFNILLYNYLCYTERRVVGHSVNGIERRKTVSENLKSVLMFAGLLAATITITCLTIWSFNKRKPDDQDDNPDLFV